MSVDINAIRTHLKQLNILQRKCEIHEDGSVTVHGNVVLINYARDVLPIQFHTVNGFFDCSKSRLTSLKGVPKVITGDFFVSS